MKTYRLVFDCYCRDLKETVILLLLIRLILLLVTQEVRNLQDTLHNIL
jgi:hypothetical protein